MQTTEWLRAVTFHERLIQPLPDGRGIDFTEGRRHLSLWRSQTPFLNDTTWTQRLELDSLSQAELIKLLGETEADLAQRLRHAPGWFAEVERLCAPDVPSQSTRESLKFDVSDFGFAAVSRPLLLDFLVRLQGLLSRLEMNNRELQQPLLSSIMSAVATRLLQQLGRTMILELNIARVSGLLQGETGEARYASFLKLIAEQPARQAFFREYPVLARAVVTTLDFAWTHVSEILERLVRDADRLRVELGEEFRPSHLRSINFGAGDSHRRGRSVAILDFEAERKLVYKPRSLSVDLHFCGLLRWCNGNGFSTPFLLPESVSSQTHGWSEHIDSAGCPDQASIERFYHRLGGLIAIFYISGSSDFHCENLIAAGEHPVPIDLEAMFHPSLREPFHSAYTEHLHAAVASSVLKIGLLPQRIWGTKTNAGLDISGIGFTGGQMTPTPVMTSARQNTDEMHIVREPMLMEESANRPTLKGSTIDAARYRANILAGFTEMYSLLEAGKFDLLSENGVLDAFAEDEVRVVVRPTRVYARILQESYHPDLLRASLDRERLLDKLWVAVEKRPMLAAFVNAEKSALRDGDVPLFVTRPGSKTIRDGEGSLIDHELAQPAMESSLKCVRNLSSSDLLRQRCIIEDTLATLVNPCETSIGPGTLAVASELSVADHTGALQAVCKIADHLIERCFEDEHFVSWIAANRYNGTSSDETWRVTPLSYGLHEGLAGLLVFFAQAAAYTGEDRFRSIARKTAYSAWTAWTETRTAGTPSEQMLSIAWGSCGLASALAEFGSLCNDTEFLARATDILAHVTATASATDRESTFSESTDLLLTLIRVQAVSRSEFITSEIGRWHSTLANMVAAPDRGGWPPPRLDEAILALTLADSFLLGDMPNGAQAWRNTALVRNWFGSLLDRTEDPDALLSAAGAVAANRELGTIEERTYAEVCRRVAELGSQDLDSLRQGEMRILEAMSTLDRHLPITGRITSAENRLNGVVNRVITDRCNFELPGLQCASLMDGLAGVGQGLLTWAVKIPRSQGSTETGSK